MLSLETPTAFEANLQNEIHLHNFATDQIENLFYFVMLLLFVFLPFASLRHWLPDDQTLIAYILVAGFVLNQRR